MKSSIFWRSLVLLMLVALIVGCGVETAVPVPLSEAEQPDIEATVAASIAATQTAESQNNPPEQPTSEPPPPPPDSEPPEEPTDAPPPQPLPDNNPELLLPFRDDFDDGLDPTWRVINGKPLIVEGRLTSANNELSMELGNTALKNYTIELDIGGSDPVKCGSIGDVTFGFSPTLHYVYHKFFGNGIGEWFLFEANDWDEISQSEQLGCGHFRIIVNGSQYQVTVNGQLAEDLIFEPAEGPLLIRLKEGAYIDNFSITP